MLQWLTMIAHGSSLLSNTIGSGEMLLWVPMQPFSVEICLLEICSMEICSLWIISRTVSSTVSPPPWRINLNYFEVWIKRLNDNIYWMPWMNAIFIKDSEDWKIMFGRRLCFLSWARHIAQTESIHFTKSKMKLHRNQLHYAATKGRLQWSSLCPYGKNNLENQIKPRVT